MIGRDAALASLFYNNNDSRTTSMKGSKSIANGFQRNSMLTMENMKLHDKQTLDANNKFYPRINKLVEMANKRFKVGVNPERYNVRGTSTNFTGSYSIFDALYDLESFNQLPSIHHDLESQATLS
jgi:hypothetical protein